MEDKTVPFWCVRAREHIEGIPHDCKALDDNPAQQVQDVTVSPESSAKLSPFAAVKGEYSRPDSPARAREYHLGFCTICNHVEAHPAHWPEHEYHQFVAPEEK